MNYLNRLIIFTVLLSCFCARYYAQDSEINFSHSLTKSMRYALKTDKFIFTYVYADWSIPCQQIESTSFRDSSIVKELNDNYINLSINSARSRTFSEEFEVHVFPTIMILDKYENSFLRFVGYKTVKELNTILNKTKSPSRYLRQNLDSLVLTLDERNVLSVIDSIEFYKDSYSAKNLVKKYLDRRKDWSDSVSMYLINDNFSLDKKYLKYISKHHKAFSESFDSLSIRENIAFHIFINSLKKDTRGRPVFNFKPVKRWFRKYKMNGVEKMEDFVRIKYLLWGRGPSIRYSVNLIRNYPETSDENVLFASVIRLLISNSRRRLDFDELIYSIESTLDDDSSFWRYDALSLLYYKMGNDAMADEAIKNAINRAESLGENYDPTLPLIKDKIER